MDSQSILFEKRAQAEINKLREKYVIDLPTGERLREIFIYLFLSRLSRNPRGINIQTEKLNAVLHGCPKLGAPAFAAAYSRKAAA